MEIKKFNFTHIIENKNLAKKSLEYLKKNPCCKNFPSCEHPVFQSDPNLWKNKNFYFLNKKIYDVICDSHDQIFNIKCNMWVYYRKQNTFLEEFKWHNHILDMNHHQISFLIYLTPTNLGTIFKNEDKTLTIVPEKNFLYLWDSRYLHSPQIGKNQEDRIVLAGACSIYL